ncbi:MAG TPA: DUF2510 domain-containing protein [Acidimicrobiales bacterium]|nr:DUF2510 domain-containing protein [Acidimicrobiales bacterium]
MVLFLILAVVFGFCAYRASESFKMKRRVTPWGLPSWVWGIIGFLSLLLWAILFLIARKTTKDPVLNESGQVATSVPEGWYPDPRSEHELRYWDGSAWTARVEDAGVEHSDVAAVEAQHADVEHADSDAH